MRTSQAMSSLNATSEIRVVVVRITIILLTVHTLNWCLFHICSFSIFWTSSILVLVYMRLKKLEIKQLYSFNERVLGNIVTTTLTLTCNLVLSIFMHGISHVFIIVIFCFWLNFSLVWSATTEQLYIYENGAIFLLKSLVMIYIWIKSGTAFWELYWYK